MSVSPPDNEQFLKIMSGRFAYEVDGWWWGGPPLPNVRDRSLRELRAAYGVVSLADSLEAAQEGLGHSLLRRFAEEPEGICPLGWPPVFPPPKGPFPEEPEPYDKAVLGAALVFSSKFSRNEELAEMAANIGNEMLG
jgi:hypothetical protein